MIDATTYRTRRTELARRVGSGLVLLPGHAESPINYRDNCHPFRQDSTLLYFCGLAQPGISLLLDCDSGLSTLFAVEQDPDDIVWTGPLPTRADSAATAGIDGHAPLDGLADLLARAQAQGRRLHQLPVARTGEATGASAELLRAVVAMRAVKSADEVAQIEATLHTTREMHLLALRQARPGVAERSVVGAMHGSVGAQGLRMAYPVIFSARGEILHNHRHDRVLAAGDLVVNDSGAESPLGYATDITRTIPVSGRFTPLQADLYRLVLKAQQEAIAMMKPGLPYRSVHERACTVLVDGLIGLGFMRGRADDAVARGAHAVLFPHGLGHLLGLDVHDMEGLGEDAVGYGEGHERSTLPGHRYLRLARPLQAGFVVTVEPGLYFNPWLAAQWRAQGLHTDLIDYDALERHMGLGGIRIEDDVLVTETGARVLGPAIARTVDEVEAACAA